METCTVYEGIRISGIMKVGRSGSVAAGDIVWTAFLLNATQEEIDPSTITGHLCRTIVNIRERPHAIRAGPRFHNLSLPNAIITRPAKAWGEKQQNAQVIKHMRDSHAVVMSYTLIAKDFRYS